MRDEGDPPPPRAPHGVQRIRGPADLARIVFTDGMAAVEAPLAMLRHVRFKNDRREDSPRLEAVAESIRRVGYRPLEPIICRIGQKGRWVVVDGGHRLTAARRVDAEFWCNLFGRRVGNLYFLLFETPRSRVKLRPAAEPAPVSGAALPAAPLPSPSPG
jgi:hypothetical protein